MQRALIVILLVVGIVALPARQAAACSCMFSPDALPPEELARAEAAVVGEVRDVELGRTPEGYQTSRWEFDVEASLVVDLGETVDVTVPGTSSSSCGVDAQPGERRAFLLYREAGGWGANLCTEVVPEALLEAARVPEPDGSGPAVGLVGPGTGVRAAAVDFAGQPLVYATEAGTLSDIGPFLDCGDPSRVVEIVGQAQDTGGETVSRIAVRDLRTFEVVAEFDTALLIGDPPTLPNIVSGAVCRDDALYVFLRNYDPPTTGPTRIERVVGERHEVVIEGLLWQLFTDGGRAYVVTGPDEREVAEINLDTGELTPVVTLPADLTYGFQAVADGQIYGIAGPQDPYNQPDVAQRLVRISLTPGVGITGEAPVPSVAQGAFPSLLPLADGRVLLQVVRPGFNELALYDRELRLVREWPGNGVVAVRQLPDGRVLGIDEFATSSGLSDAGAARYVLTDPTTESFAPAGRSGPLGEPAYVFDQPVEIQAQPGATRALELVPVFRPEPATAQRPEPAAAARPPAEAPRPPSVDGTGGPWSLVAAVAVGLIAAGTGWRAVRRRRRAG